MSERNPVFSPRPGDIVRSCHESIGERHVLHVSDCGVRYVRVRPKNEPQEGYCLPGVWTKWCRSHRVEIIQQTPGA